MKNFFWNWGFDEVKGQMKKFKENGFSQMRFPGGTSYDGSINSTVIKFQLSPFGQLYFVVVFYDFNSKIVNEQLNTKENKYQLSIRKFKEETGILIHICDLRQIWEIVVSDNRFHGDNKNHVKNFFLTFGKSEGQFVDLSNSSYLKRETIPLLVPGWFIPKVLFHRHLEAFEMAINEINLLIEKKDKKLIDLVILIWDNTKKEQSKELFIESYLKKININLINIRKSINQRKKHLNDKRTEKR